MFLPSINFSYLTVSEMQPEKEFQTQGQQQGQRSNQGHAMTLHSYVPQPMSPTPMSPNQLPTPNYGF